MRSLADAEALRATLSRSEWMTFVTLYTMAAKGDGTITDSIGAIARAVDVNPYGLPRKLDALIAADLISVEPASPAAVHVRVH